MHASRRGALRLKAASARVGNSSSLERNVMARCIRDAEGPSNRSPSPARTAIALAVLWAECVLSAGCKDRTAPPQGTAAAEAPPQATRPPQAAASPRVAADAGPWQPRTADIWEMPAGVENAWALAEGEALRPESTPSLKAALAGDAPLEAKPWDPPPRRLELRAKPTKWTLRDRATIDAAPARPTAIDWSPDGRWIAAVDAEGRAFLWSARDGVLMKTLYAEVRLEGRGLKSAAFHPKRRVLAGGGAGGVRLWDVDRETLLKILPNDKDVETIRFAADGRRLYALGGGELIAWEVDSGRRRAVECVVEGASRALAVSSDGARLATPQGQGEVVLRDADSLAEVGRFKAHERSLESLDFAPDGKSLATLGAYEHLIQLWNPADGRKLSGTEDYFDGNGVLRLSPGGDFAALASVGDDYGALSVRSMTPDGSRSNQSSWDLGHSDGWPDVPDLAFSPDGRAIVAWTSTTKLHLVDVLPDVAFQSLSIGEEFRRDLQERTFAAAARGLWVVAGTGKRPFGVEQEKGAVVGLLDESIPVERIQRTAVSADGRSVWTAARDEAFQWNPADGKVLRRLPQKFRSLRDLAVSPDGGRLAILGEIAPAGYEPPKPPALGAKPAPIVWPPHPPTDPLLLIDAQSGALLRTIPGPLPFADRLTFSPDGRRLAAWNEFGVELRDAETGERLHSPRPRDLPLKSATFSRDGMLLATAGGDRDGPAAWRKGAPTQERSVEVWNVADGRRRWTFPLLGPPGDMLFSPDGRLLVVSAQQQNLSIFDLESGTELQPEGSTRGPAAALASVDDATFAAFDPYGRVRRLRFADLHEASSQVPDADLLRGDAPSKGLGPAASASWFEIHSAEAFALSPDESLLATAQSDQILLWSFPAWRRTLMRKKRPTTSYWIPGSDWGVPIVRFLRHPGSKVKALAFSPDGKTLYGVDPSAWAGALLAAWDVESGTLLQERSEAPLIDENHDRILKPSPDGRRVVVADQGAPRPWGRGGKTPPTVRIYEPRTLRRSGAFEPGGPVQDLAFAADGTLVVAVEGGAVQFWNLDTEKQTGVWPAKGSGLLRMDVSPDGKTLALLLKGPPETARTHLYDLESRKRTASGPLAPAAGARLAFTPDGKRLLRFQLDPPESDWDDARNPSGWATLCDPVTAAPQKTVFNQDALLAVRDGKAAVFRARTPEPGVGFIDPPQLSLRSLDDLFDDAFQARAAAVAQDFEGKAEVGRDGEYWVLTLHTAGRKADRGLAAVREWNAPVILEFQAHLKSWPTDRDIEALAGAENVCGLRAGYCCRFTSAGLETLATLPNLEELAVIAEAPAEVWPRVLQAWPKLRMLRLQAKLESNAALAAIGAISSLEILEIELGDGVDDVGLAELARLKNLRELRISLGNNISEAGLRRLASLAKLQSLEIEPAAKIDAGLDVLAHFPRLFNLELVGPQVGDETLRHVGAAKALTRLWLRNTNVVGPGFVHLANTTTLKHLDIYGEAFRGSGIEHLAKNKGLRDLDLTFAELDPAGAAALGKLVSLEVLRLPDGADDALLAALAGPAGLVELSAGRSRATGAGLAALRSLPALEVLKLPEAPIGDEGLEHLAAAPGLRWIDLSGSKITDAGAVHWQKLRRLRFLELSRTKIGDETLRRLAAMKSLRKVDLYETQVSDAARQVIRSGPRRNIQPE